MRPKVLDIDPADVDADGIAEAQQLVGAGNVVLDGALCDLGTAAQFDIGDSYSSGIGGVQLAVASAGDVNTVTFTFTGKDENGADVTDTVTGVNANSVETTEYFSQVTQIAADAAVGVDITIGTVDEIITKTIPLDWRGHEATTVAVMGLSGTCQFDIDESFDDPASITNWITNQADKSADLTASLTLHARAARLKFDSYTNAAELQWHILHS
jgi:hypothetical protein